MTKKLIKEIEALPIFIKWALTEKGRRTGYFYFQAAGYVGKIHVDDYLKEMRGKKPC